MWGPFANITDIIVGLVLAVYFLNGMRKGLIRTLLGPISLIIACFIAFIYFHQTKNLIISLLISIIGPVIISITVIILLKFWNKFRKKESSLTKLSRLVGGCISLFWSGIIIALVLLFISIFPMTIGKLKTVQNNVITSNSYRAVFYLKKQLFPKVNIEIQKLIEVLDDPKKLKKIQQTQSYQDLMADKKFQELIDDQETIKQLKEKDMAKLFTNRKLLAIMKDPELLKKFLALHQEILSDEKDENVAGN